jgi:hypothetical protein
MTDMHRKDRTQVQRKETKSLPPLGRDLKCHRTIFLENAKMDQCFELFGDFLAFYWILLLHAWELRRRLRDKEINVKK